ncbi:hypothetical protein BsWGS_05162 [Bradybaena similaris]
MLVININICTEHVDDEKNCDQKTYGKNDQRNISIQPLGWTAAAGFGQQTLRQGGEFHVRTNKAKSLVKPKLHVLMEILKLPPEIIENIFLHLDTQALCCCALANSHLANIVYSTHFLDLYCRATLSSSWVTAADVCNMALAVPFEFWFWVYTTVKLQDNYQASVIFHNKYLTKIGTLRHMYIQWLISGLRKDFIYSHSLMYQVYPLPDTVNDLFELLKEPVPEIINNTLLKIFIGLPEIMKLTCSNILVFQMQHGGSTSIYMEIVCNDGIQPKLPHDFSCLFSVELILTVSFGKHPSILILIGKDKFVLWMGNLFISFDDDETSIAGNIFCRYFSHEEKISEIRLQAQQGIINLCGDVYKLRDASPCPIICGSFCDQAAMTISIAQEHHQELKQKFDSALVKACSALVSSIIAMNCLKPHDKEIIAKSLNVKISQNKKINEYVLKLLKTEMPKVLYNTTQHLSFLVYKCIVERLASLFRTEIHLNVENTFCHSFLCGCMGPTYNASLFGFIEGRVEKCLSEKLKGGLYSPDMWPPHVTSAACQIVPVLTKVLEEDVQMITSKSLKYVVPDSFQRQTSQRLKSVGLALTNRPLSKPRRPPLLKQVRYWNIESLM